MKTIALIGCGIWGSAILRTLMQFDLTIIVVEPNVERAQAAKQNGASETLATIDDLPIVDGVIIATPASTHLEVVRSLKTTTTPIFIEKPLAASENDAKEIERLVGSRGFVMHVWRYHSGVKKLAALNQSGRLGKPIFLRTERKNWTSPRQDVDATWTLLPHDISIAKAILGAIPPPVFAHAEMLNGKAVGMLAGLSDGTTSVVMDVSTRFTDKRREIRLHAEKGVATFKHDSATNIEIAWNETLPGGCPELENIPFENEPPLTTELEAFVRHVNGGPPPPTDLSEGSEVVSCVEHLRRLAGLK